MTAHSQILPTRLPVIVIGAGPVGLAAAAHLIARDIPVKLLDAGASVAANVRSWGHVQLFSPWSYNIDKAARALLDKTGWQAPKRSAHPTGADLYEQYLQPLAATPEIAAVTELNARVTGVSRLGFDKMKSAGREHAPFSVMVETQDGQAREDLASAVIDTSGTWSQPNPIGSNGLPVPGETAAAKSDPWAIAYGVPDVLGKDAAHYAGRRVLVIGAGHSAANVLLDLAKLTGTEIIWAVRGASLARLFGGGANDKLAARGALGQALETLVKAGGIDLRMHRTVTRIETGDALHVTLATPGWRCADGGGRPHHRGHRAAAGPGHAARDPPRSRPGHRKPARAGTDDRSQSAFLRHRASAWPSRTGAARCRLLYRRHQELWPRADLPAGNRL
jgi:hypothetical protein